MITFLVCAEVVKTSTGRCCSGPRPRRAEPQRCDPRRVSCCNPCACPRRLLVAWRRSVAGPVENPGGTGPSVRCEPDPCLDPASSRSLWLQKDPAVKMDYIDKYLKITVRSFVLAPLVHDASTLERWPNHW